MAAPHSGWAPRKAQGTPAASSFQPSSLVGTQEWPHGDPPSPGLRWPHLIERRSRDLSTLRLAAPSLRLPRPSQHFPSCIVSPIPPNSSNRTQAKDTGNTQTWLILNYSDCREEQRKVLQKQAAVMFGWQRFVSSMPWLPALSNKVKGHSAVFLSLGACAFG